MQIDIEKITLGVGGLRERARKEWSNTLSLSSSAFSSACKSESAALQPEKSTIGPVVSPPMRI